MAWFRFALDEARELYHRSDGVLKFWSNGLIRFRIWHFGLRN